MLWAHHEKIVVVDQIYAFVGGIDLCYGRYLIEIFNWFIVIKIKKGQLMSLFLLSINIPQILGGIITTTISRT